MQKACCFASTAHGLSSPFGPTSCIHRTRQSCRVFAVSTSSRLDSRFALVKTDITEEQEKMLDNVPSLRSEQHDQLTANHPIPLPVEGCERVYRFSLPRHTTAATPYMIVRPEGNILVDCPRYNHALSEEIRALGGIRYIVFSNSDSAGDHQKWAKRFNCQRVAHKLEKSSEEAEIQLEGEGPWTLPDGSPDHEIMFTPGYSAGSISLWFKPDQALFTGCHLAYSTTIGRLTIFRHLNRGGVDRQLTSVKKLADLEVRHLLPRYAKTGSYSDNEEWKKMVEQLIEAESMTAQQ